MVGGLGTEQHQAGRDPGADRTVVGEDLDRHFFVDDADRALIEPLLPPRPHSVSGHKHPYREIVNAILHVARSGIAWRYMPHDLPPHTTVHDYFARWEADGTTERVHDDLRRRKGRRTAPTAAAIDSRTVKSSHNAPAETVGHDAAKRTKGRKHHIATDTPGLLPVLIVTAASVQDSPGDRRVAGRGQPRNRTR